MTALTPQLLHRFDRVGPRYTSYPTADRMHADFGLADYMQALAALDRAMDVPLSVYAHFPHCHQICRYCACNIIGTRSDERRQDYVGLLLREIALVTERIPHRRRLGQLHFGGGTPNSYAIASLAAIVDAITTHFHPEPEAEISIEIDPRHATVEQLGQLARVGFNRVSLGVQDFDDDVQAAIGRHQSAAQTRMVVEAARAAGFSSINTDLVYGLPCQTRSSFADTLTSLIALRPDRIALFSFAFIPRLRINQRRISPTSLPPTEDKLMMLCDARAALGAAGYVAVGMDHFALPSDALATAQAARRLSRNFQGYSVKPAGVEGEVETLGLGLTSIGDIGGTLMQNAKDIESYAAAIGRGALPVARGVTRTEDDLLRCAIIGRIMTDFRVPGGAVGEFSDAQVGALVRSVAPVLDRHVVDGLLRPDAGGYVLTELGELFPRLIAMAFDAHYAPEHAAFSRVV